MIIPTGLVCAKLLVLLLVGQSSSSEDPPVVKTEQGLIVGTRLQFNPIYPLPELRSRSVDAYLGIPYGEPPVGPLRFKPPVKKSWSGDLQATQLGNRCPQVPEPFFDIPGPYSEDCLVLDVYVPQPVVSSSLLVHGLGELYLLKFSKTTCISEIIPSR